MKRRIRVSAGVRLTAAVAFFGAAAGSAIAQGNSATGQTLWNNTACAGCHTLALVQGRITARAPAGLTYQKSLDSLNASLTGTSLNGTPTGMQGFAAALNTQNRADLAAYIAGLPAPAPAVSFAPAGGPQFPATAVGATSSQTTTITNSGTAALVFAVNNAVTIATGGDAADFRITSSTCPGVTLQPNTGSCTINATFQPTAATATTRTASIGLAHNMGATGTSLVPMQGIVGGTTAPPATSPPTGSANAPSSGGGGALPWAVIALLAVGLFAGSRKR